MLMIALNTYARYGEDAEVKIGSLNNPKDILYLDYRNKSEGKPAEIIIVADDES
jgi:hypothetical protein